MAVSSTLLAASACGTSSSAPSADIPSIRVTERDFRITAPKRLRPGVIALRVRNKGPDDHELIVVRAPAGRLPLRADGVTVDEDRLEPTILGTLEPGEPNTVRTLRLRLAAGTYELLCNMAGHFLGGMHAKVVVR